MVIDDVGEINDHVLQLDIILVVENLVSNGMKRCTDELCAMRWWNGVSCISSTSYQNISPGCDGGFNESGILHSLKSITEVPSYNIGVSKVFLVQQYIDLFGTYSFLLIQLVQRCRHCCSRLW